MAEVMEKVYSNPTNDSGLLAELINANGRNQDCGMNGMWNNPFMYLIWLALFNGNGFGFGGRNGQEALNVEFMSRLNHIETQMQDNHANQLAMDAIKGNSIALHELAGSLNVGVVDLGRAVAQVQSSIDKVGGITGMTGERVINSVILGNKDITKAITDCCCQTQQNILKSGYEALIRDMQNTHVLSREVDQLGHGLYDRLVNMDNNNMSKLSSINTGMERGFSAVAYESQKQTCDVINAGKDNTQRIIDTLNNHWQAETSQALQSARFEISQMKLNQYLVDKLKTE